MRTTRACGILLGLVLGALPLPAGAQATSPPSGVKIQGRILDSESRAAIDLVEVVVVGASSPVYTDEKGRFVFESIAPGTYTLSATRLGFAPLRRQLVVVAGQAQSLDLQLVRNAVPLEQVTVTPGTFSFMGQGTSTHQTMSREDIKAVPMIGEDIFRAVNRLPGLVSNDYSAHFGIRGGLHGETLILLDGLQLYEPYHLKDFNEGAISVIDAETIDGVQLMTGGFPARYGNKRSGVFDVTSRTPEPNRTYFDFGTSMMNTRAMGRGSFAGDKGSWLAFGRYGYMGLILQMIDQADLPNPNYWDAFGRGSYMFSSRNEVTVEVLHALDKSGYDIPATTGFRDTVNTLERADNHYGNTYVWATYKATLSTKTTVRTMLSGGFVSRYRQGSERDITKIAPFYFVNNDRFYTTYGIAQDWTHGFSDRDILSFGVDFR